MKSLNINCNIDFRICLVHFFKNLIISMLNKTNGKHFLNYIKIMFQDIITKDNRISVVLIRVLALSVIDRGSTHRSIKTKDYIIDVCCSTPPSTHHYRMRSKTGSLSTNIICPSGVTGLPMDCCISELALWRKPQINVMVQYKAGIIITSSKRKLFSP